MTWVRKDPDARLDYAFVWDLQDGETITSSTWTPDAGLTVDGQAIDGARVSAFVSGGAVGDRLKVVNRVVTSLGRSDDQTLHFMIENA